MRLWRGVLIAILLLPALASAQSVSDLQAQIAKLMAQIQSLQGLSAQVPNVGSASASAGVSCPQLSLNISRGNRDSETGGEVSRLQLFLSQYYRIPESDIVTGFFGPLTEANVKKFQGENGIEPLGRVGPITRTAIARMCAGGTVPQTATTLTVAPSSGNAPLAVSFGLTIAVNCTATYVMDFGDGQTQNVVSSCGASTLTHTYATQGTFVAHLDEVVAGGRVPKAQISVVVSAPNTPTCAMSANKTSIVRGEAVTVSWSSQGATSAAWTSGQSGTAPLSGNLVAPSHATTTTYAITFTGASGTKSCSITITVQALPVGTVSASGNAIANGATVTAPNNASQYKLAQFTLSAGSNEDVQINSMKFTVRNAASSDPAGRAAALTNYRVTIGTNSYTPSMTQSGNQDTGTISPNTYITRETSMEVSIYADVVNFGGGFVDLWVYPADLSLTGKGTNQAITATSSVTNRVDTALLYWSGWIKLNAGDTGCSYTSGNYTAARGTPKEFEAYSPGTAVTIDCRITAEVVESYPESHAAIVEFGIPLPMLQATPDDPSRFQMLRFTAGQGTPFGLWPGSCPSAINPDAVATHFVLYQNSAYAADQDPAGGNMCKIKMSITGPGVFEARLIDPRKSCGSGAISCPGYVLDSIRYTVE